MPSLNTRGFIFCCALIAGTTKQITIANHNLYEARLGVIGKKPHTNLNFCKNNKANIYFKDPGSQVLFYLKLCQYSSSYFGY